MVRMVVPCMAAAGWCCTRGGWLSFLLLLLACDVLPYALQVITVLLSTAWAGVVVLILQPLVAEQAHLVPAATGRGGGQQQHAWMHWGIPRLLKGPHYQDNMCLCLTRHNVCLLCCRVAAVLCVRHMNCNQCVLAALYASF